MSDDKETVKRKPKVIHARDENHVATLLQELAAVNIAPDETKSVLGELGAPASLAGLWVVLDHLPDIFDICVEIDVALKS